MAAIFWTGKLSLHLQLMVNISCLISWITGNARNTSAMKKRVQNGYNAKYSNYVERYDENGLSHYSKISAKLIEGVDIRDKEVMDVGCGTGILSIFALKQNPAKMICGDMSEFMLGKCREKVQAEGFSDAILEFRQIDAESLPLNDESVDVVISSMMLGLIPNQTKAISEMRRVLRPNGILALSTHGPEHYREAIEAGLKVMTSRYFFGYRFEFWPRREVDIQNMFINNGLEDIRTERLTWVDRFNSGCETFDFYASTSSLWWYDKLPSDLREKETAKTRDFFDQKGVTQITSDTVFAYGKKR